MDLLILDISVPSLPVVTGRTEPLPGVVTDIYVSGGHAYVAAGGAGLRVIDVSIPSAPIEVGFYGWGERSATDLAVVGDYAYVATIEAGLGVIDVSVPSAPFEVAFYALEGLALDVEAIDDRAYVACDDRGLV